MWKLLSVPVFTGTPYEHIRWRLAGRPDGQARLFNDESSMVEETLLAIGNDRASMPKGTIRCHSLEDGKFTSGHIVIGSGITLGVHAFVHYGAYMGDGIALDTNSFLMGEKINPGERWSGNPASRTG